MTENDVQTGQSSTGQAGTQPGQFEGGAEVSLDRTPFLLAISLSAFLLFSLELLAGRLVLPVFGGAPAVWTTTLCFFTAVLFVGYAYSHYIATRFSPWTGGIIQVGLAIAMVALTLAAPADVASLRLPGLPPALNVLVALCVIAGPAALLLASTTPLLSAWYAGGRDAPWWLYAASNAASFAALICYPFLVAPLLSLSMQRSLLALGLSVFGVLLTWTLIQVRRQKAPAVASDQAGTNVSRFPAPAYGGRRLHSTASNDAHDPSDPASCARLPNQGQARKLQHGGLPAGQEALPAATARPWVACGSHETLTWRRQVLWLLAAAIPAGLMSATSIFITTDLVAAPLIWIGPLGVYLASYVVVFSQRGRRMLQVAEWLTPAAATLMWLPFVQNGWPVLPLLIVVNAALFVLAIAIHGRLALDRPAHGELTRFYLVISLGGLVATAFVALLAPVIFSLIYEYPLLIAAAMVMRVLLPTPLYQPAHGLLSNPRGAASDLIRRLAPYALIAATIYMNLSDDPAEAARMEWLLLFGAAVVAVSVNPRVSAIATLAAIELLIVSSGTHPLLRQRTFFGVTEVVASGSEHAMYSGTTLHGLQFTDGRAREPTSYYSRKGPLGAVFEDLYERTNKAAIGVVGLGVGTIAAYARPVDKLTFFELDSAIIDIATNPRYFTYIRNAAVKPKIVRGDGRLSLEREPPATFDLLVLDAFNSDVVPAHLLTREAMAMYRTLLRPGGLLAVHLSNRFYNLAFAVGPTLHNVGLTSAGSKGGYIDKSRMNEAGSTLSLWVVAGEPEDVARFTARGWVPLPVTGPVLSDDHSDLTRLLAVWGE